MVYFTVGIPKEAGGMFENPKLIRNGNKYPKRKGDPDGVQMHFFRAKILGPDLSSICMLPRITIHADTA